MAKMSDDKLRELAKQRCEEAVAELFEGEYVVDSGEGATAWDPMLQRHVYSESLSVWREFNAIEVVTTPEGKLVSFRDPSRFLGEEAPPAPKLGDEQIVAIARTTGLLGPSAVLLRRDAGKDQMISADITQVEPGMPSDVSVTINPVLGQVAAFRVKGS